jgi:hypothetical protein
MTRKLEVISYKCHWRWELKSVTGGELGAKGVVTTVSFLAQGRLFEGRLLMWVVYLLGWRQQCHLRWPSQE